MDEAWMKTIDTAESLLREHGWRQGFDGMREGKQCLGTALQSASKSIGLHWPDILAKTNEILEFGGHSVEPLVKWNDAPGRTEEEVFKALEVLRNGH